jgi:hypothetical protein
MYLNCPYCPSQSYPTNKLNLWLTGMKVEVPLIEFKCILGHVHYAVTEHKEEINGERIIESIS